MYNLKIFDPQIWCAQHCDICKAQLLSWQKEDKHSMFLIFDVKIRKGIEKLSSFKIKANTCR